MLFLIFPAVLLLQNAPATTGATGLSSSGEEVSASVSMTGPNITRGIAGEQSVVFGFVNGLFPSIRYDKLHFMLIKYKVADRVVETNRSSVLKPICSIVNSEVAVDDQDSFDVIISRLMEEYRPRSLPTALTIRNNLPLYKVRPANASGEPRGDEAFATAQDPCSVCHEEFLEGNRVAELPCSHCFHQSCLVPWLETHNTCPVCRIDLPFENR
jgi:hypothetical protein